MATKLEVLINTIFGDKGTKDAIASIHEVQSELDALSSDRLGETTTDINVEITTDDSEVIASREEIRNLAELSPVVELMTDNSKLAATREEVMLLANESPLISPIVNDSNIVATRAEIEYLSAIHPLISPSVNNAPIVATAEEITALAWLEPLISPTVDNSGITATREEIAALASMQPVISPIVDNTNLVASREEIRELAARGGPISVTVNVTTNGLEEAIIGLALLRQEAEELNQGQGQGLDLVDADFVDILRAMTTAYDENAQAAREALREAVAFGADDKAVAKLKQADSAARTAAEAMHLYATATQKEAIAATKAGQSLGEQVIALKASKRQHDLMAESLLKQGPLKASEAKSHLNTSNAIQQEISMRERLISSLNDYKQVSQSAGDAIRSQFNDAGITTMDAFNTKVNEVRASLRSQRDAALESGTAFTGSLDSINAQEQALNQLESQLNFTGDSYKYASKNTEGFGGALNKLMKSTFNTFGFVMFITENTVKSLVRIMNAFTGVFTVGQDSANKFRAEMLAVSQDIGDFNNSLLESSAYTLDIGTATQEAAFFVNQYGDTYPALVQKLAEASRAILVLGGSQEEANKFFADQLKSVDDLSTGYNRYGVTLFDTTRAQDEWNLAAARGEDLLDSEKRATLVDVINQEADAKIAAAGGTDTYNASLDEMTKSTMGGWTAIKAFVGSGLGSYITILKGTVSGLTEADDATGGFSNTIVNLISKIPILNANLSTLSLFLEGGIRGVLLGLMDELDSVLTAFGGIIIGVKLGLTDLFAATISLGEALGKVGEGLNALLHLDFSGMKQAFSEIPTMLTDAFAEFDLKKAFEEGFAIAEEASDALFDPMRNSLGAITEEIEDKEIKGPKIDLSSPLEQLKGILDGQYELQKNMQDAWDGYNEKIKDISDQLTEDLKELQDTRYEDLLAAAIEYQEKSAKAQEDYADKILDINGKLQKDEFRTQEDAEDNRNKARRDHNKKLIEIEEDHQKKLKEIMRKFDLDRLKALIDRDARALYEAERRRDEDLKKEQEAAKEKKDNELDSLAEKLSDIDAAEEKKLRRMREDAEEERRQTLANYKEKLDDLEKANADEIAEIEETYIEKRNIARREAFQDKIDAKKEWNDKKNQLVADLKEREHIEQAANLQKQLLIIRDMQDHGKDVESEYDDWLEDFRQLKDDHNEIVSEFNYPDPLNLTGLSGPIDPPPGGPGGSDPGDGCVPGHNIKYTPTVGMGCSNVVSTMIVTACDGSKWNCIGGGWYPAGTADVQQTSDSGGDGKKKRVMSFGTDVSDNSGGRTGSNGNQVTIVVEGDKTLEQIFREISFSAYIETIT